MNQIIDTNFGTSSGSSTEEDPPSGFNAPLVRSNEQNGNKALCDFRIIRSLIDKEESPLFKNFKGKIYCYLPYQSLLENGNEIKLKHESKKGRLGNSRLNIYMSEVSVLYAGPNNYTGDEVPDNKDEIDVRQVTKSKRNHIFLGQSIWLKEPPGKQKQGEFGRGDKVEGQYIIHEIRPVNHLEHWSDEKKVKDTSNDTSRIRTKATGNRFVRDIEGLYVKMWLVIARPIKWQLKPKNNDYYVGLVETEDGVVPQLYQNVSVYKNGSGTHIPISINDKCSKDPVARFHIAPCIELEKTPDNKQ